MTYRIYNKPDTSEYYGVQLNDNEEIVHAVFLEYGGIPPYIGTDGDSIQHRIEDDEYNRTRVLARELRKAKQWH